MNLFHLHEYLALNDGLTELYSSHDLLQLAHASIRLIRMCVPNDMTIYTLSDPLCPESAGVFEPSHHELPAFDAPYRAFCSRHPIMLHFYRTGSGSAIRFEDTIERNALESLDLYNQFFRPLHMKDLMGILFRDNRGRELAIGSSREKPFTERERGRLEFLRPHISRAFSNAALVAHARRKPFSPGCLLKQGRGSMLINTVRVSQKDLGVMTLTMREIEILHWISEGKSNPEISIILGISPRTAQKHVENIFRKLGVSSRTSAAMRAIELGIANTTAGGSDYEQLITAREKSLQHATAPRLVG